MNDVEMVLTSINDRWNLLLPAHRAARPQWPWWEATRLAAMYHFMHPGMLVIDVGAEEGDFAALYARWGCRVILIEPNPKAWPNIRAIFQANELTRMIHTKFQCLCSDEDDSRLPLPFLFDWPDAAYEPVVPDHGFMQLGDNAQRARLDSIIKGPVDVITMDVEGGEFHVLRGAVETLALHRPMVFVSVHEAEMLRLHNEKANDLFIFMERLGYAIEVLGSDHEEHVMFVPNERMWVQ